MPKKKDVMYDFGELGKWSEKTLLANRVILEKYVSDPFCKWGVPIIEERYEELWERSRIIKVFYMDKKIRRMPVSDLADDLIKYTNNEANKRKLISDYKTYQGVVNIILSEEKKNGKMV